MLVGVHDRTFRATRDYERSIGRRMLDYEQLDVYRCAIEHLALVFKWSAW